MDETLAEVEAIAQELEADGLIIIHTAFRSGARLALGGDADAVLATLLGEPR